MEALRDRIGERLEPERVPARPRRSPAIVPVGGVTRPAREAISAAPSPGDRVVALRVTPPGGPEETTELIGARERRAPDVGLALVGDRHLLVLTPEAEPAHLWQRILQNRRGAVLALRRDTDAVVCRPRFRLDDSPARARGHNA
jgi:hypothetical protein